MRLVWLPGVKTWDGLGVKLAIVWGKLDRHENYEIKHDSTTLQIKILDIWIVKTCFRYSHKSLFSFAIEQCPVNEHTWCLCMLIVMHHGTESASYYLKANVSLRVQDPVTSVSASESHLSAPNNL